MKIDLPIVGQRARGPSRVGLGERLRSSGLAWLGPTIVSLLLSPTTVSSVALSPTGASIPAQSPTRVSPPAQSPTSEEKYWCSMHPDVRSAVPGTCPICHMRLVRIAPAAFSTNPVDLRATAIVGGVRLRLTVRDPETRAIERQFDLVHERTMHLFVVGGDGLSYFTHEHPAQQPDGVFMLDVPLPQAGPYMAIAEFLPTGGTPQVFQQVFTTGEPFAPREPPAADPGPKIVDGMRVTIDASKLKGGEEGKLSFRIDDAASDAAVTDLEPYLGASAHLLVVTTDLTEAIHGHPTDEARGPDLSFTPILPRAGRYKMWLQVQRAGRVSTVPFVIDVP